MPILRSRLFFQGIPILFVKGFLRGSSPFFQGSFSKEFPSFLSRAFCGIPNPSFQGIFSKEFLSFLSKSFDGIPNSFFKAFFLRSSYPFCQSLLTGFLILFSRLFRGFLSFFKCRVRRMPILFVKAL